MIGWGLYKVTLSSEDGDLVFWLNTIDGNWMNPALDGKHDFAIRVRQPWFGPPVCHVRDWDSYNWLPINHNSTLGYWDISVVPRGRDILERAWDYDQNANIPAPFVIADATDYPLDGCDPITYAKLDVNAELQASFMNIRSGRVFEIADWTDEQNQVQATTLTVFEDNTLRVAGELRLTGNEIDPDVYSVTLRGLNPLRGYWTGVKTSAHAQVTAEKAHILHAVRGVELVDSAYLDADSVEIAEFSQYGVYHSNASAKVRNARIHNGSIGVYATGTCFDTYYGWRDEEGPEEPVYVYNCDGHGFELVNLTQWVSPSGDLGNQRGFCIQFSEIYQNQLYGIWCRGTGSPLVNKNTIYENGRRGGQNPSHDGVHVNVGSYPSLHHNKVYRNAYGFHHNDGGYVMGHPFGMPYTNSLPRPWMIEHQNLGFNCLIVNTINLGNNRSAESNFGQGFNGQFEWDGTPKKWGGSNVFADPVSGIQASNGTGIVYAEHNCWAPAFVVTGVIITNNDFADCATHHLPDCETPPEPGGTSVLFSAMSGANQPSSALLGYLQQQDWTALKAEALNILSTSSNPADIASAAIHLARLRGTTNDASVEGYLSAFLGRAAGMVLPLSTRHAVLTSMLYIKLQERNAVEALQLCALIEQQCAGTELAKTGELFRGMILGDLPGSHSAAVAVASDMLQRDPSDAEALALYYSLTHSYPGSAPKSAAVLPNSDIVLYQNYPNPFNPNTAISFSVPEPMHVRLYVRDVTGVLLATLIDGEVPAGISTASFDASALRSGVYFYTLETVGGSISRRMALVK